MNIYIQKNELLYSLEKNFIINCFIYLYNIVKIDYIKLFKLIIFF